MNVSKATFIAGMLTAASFVSPAPKVAPEQAVPLRIFIRGGADGIKALRMGWPERDVGWVVKSGAGTIAAGSLRTDKNGIGSVSFAVPQVRAAVHLALKFFPEGQPDGAGHTVEVVVLPRNPFGRVIKKLGKLRVGFLPAGPLVSALKRSGLRVTDLDHGPARNTFKGNVVIVGGLLEKSVAATRKWIGSMPAGTCLIVVNDGLKKNSVLSIIEYLERQDATGESRFFVDNRSAIWTELPADWLACRSADYALGPPKQLTSLRILAGHFQADGATYPLALEARDIGGRWWLIWNLRDLPHRDDPRLDLILRNSLLWAHRRTAINKRP